MRFPPTRKQVQFYRDIEDDQQVKLNLGKSKEYKTNDYERQFIFLKGRLTLNQEEISRIKNLGSKKDNRPICVKCHNRVKNIKSLNFQIHKVCSTFCRKNI